MALKVAGSIPVSHPIDCNSLRGSELRHIPDGDNPSGIFYLATSLGLRALFPSENIGFFKDLISDDKESNYA